MNNSQNPSNQFLPVWVWLIVFLQIGLVFFFSAGTAMDPGQFIPHVTELNYVIQLYITRNVTVALAIVFALMMKSHKALFVVLLIRLLTDIADVITVYMLNVEVIKSSVPMVVVLLIIPALLAIIHLSKRFR